MIDEPGSGTHRYALLAYKQPRYQTIEPPAKRASFQVCALACSCVCVVEGGGHDLQRACRLHDSLEECARTYSLATHLLNFNPLQLPD